MTARTHVEPEGLFVYGTLRPDRAATTALAGWVHGGRPSRHAVAVGARLWYVDRLRAGYPVLTVHDAAPHDGVHGDLVDVDPWDVPEIVDMELAVGYRLRPVDLELSGGRRVRAWAFVWESDDHGPRVWSDDWRDRNCSPWA